MDDNSIIASNEFFLPPANEVCEGYVFTGVCLSTAGGHAWFYFGGACMVLFGGWHAWFYLGGASLYSGGMRGFIRGGMRGFFSFFGYNEIRSMSGRYASYWNAFLFKIYPKSELMHEQKWS